MVTKKCLFFTEVAKVNSKKNYKELKKTLCFLTTKKKKYYF